MEFFDSLKKNLSAAADYTAKKATDLTEITKLRFDIRALERKLDEIFLEMGKTLYFEENDGKMDEYREKIDSVREKIAALQLELAKVRGYVLCPSCQIEVEENAQFCPQCGAKLQKQPAGEQNTDD